MDNPIKMVNELEAQYPDLELDYVQINGEWVVVGSDPNRSLTEKDAKAVVQAYAVVRLLITGQGP
jgi:hypothetical protein